MIKSRLTTVRITHMPEDFEINLVTPELMLLLIKLQDTIGMNFLKLKYYVNQTEIPP